MGEKKRVNNSNSLIAIFSVLLVFSIVMMIVERVPMGEKVTGYATTEISTVSNVSIQSYLSIDMSTNLTSGVLFGTVTSLPATNVNSTHNYDGQVGVVNTSSMSLNVSTDSNTPVDFCIKTNDDLYDSTGGNLIAIGNETYSNFTSTNLTHPQLSKETSLSKTAYAKSGVGIVQGGNIYYRFWLDVPAATPAGSYNNSISFKGVTNGTACGS